MWEEALEKHITPSVNRITFSNELQWCFEPIDSDYSKPCTIQQNSIWTEPTSILWALKYRLFEVNFIVTGNIDNVYIIQIKGVIVGLFCSECLGGLLLCLYFVGFF